MDPLAALLDEVCLEGLDGITVDTLWLRLGARAPAFPLHLEAHVRQYLWSALATNSSIIFYLLPRSRAPVVLTDRFSDIDPETGFQDVAGAQMDIQVQDPYPVCVLVDNPGGVQGSCLYFKEREDITHYIRTSQNTPILTLDQAVSMYGERLVMVASQELRYRALIGPEGNPEVRLSDYSYCILERLGRARWQGELQRDLHILSFKMDARKLHYLRRSLDRNGLITMQSHVVRLPSGVRQHSILLLLKRFHVDRRSKYDILMEATSNLLSELPHNTGIVLRLREQLRVGEHTFKRVYQYMQASKMVSILTVPLQELNPEAGPCKTKRGKDVRVRCLKLLKPYSRKDLGGDDEDEDDDNDEDGEGPVKRTVQPQARDVERDLLSQAYEIVMAMGPKGISQTALSMRLNIGKLEGRMVCRVLEKHNMVKGFVEDEGRQRTTKYVSKVFVEKSKLNLQFTKERERSEKLRKPDSTGTQDRTEPPMDEEDTPQGILDTEQDKQDEGKNIKGKRLKTKTGKKMRTSVKCAKRLSKSTPKHSTPIRKKMTPRRRTMDQSGQEEEPSQADQRGDSLHVPEAAAAGLVLSILSQSQSMEDTEAVVEEVVQKPEPGSMKKKAYEQKESYRLLRRRNLIIETVRNMRVIEGLYTLQKKLVEEEKQDGVSSRVCKKSILRLIQTLAREGYLKLFRTIVVQDGVSKKMEFVVHPSVSPDDPLIKSAIEQVRFKISCSYTVHRLKMEEEKAKTQVQETSKDDPQCEVRTPQKNTEENPRVRDLKNFKPTIVPGLSRSLGFQTKMPRLRIVHMFLFYLIYGHPLNHTCSTDPTDPQASSGPSTDPQASSGPFTDPQASSGSSTDPQASSGPSTDPQASSGPSIDPQASSGPSTDPRASPGPSTDPRASSGPSTDPRASSGPSTDPRASSGPSTDLPISSVPSTGPQTPSVSFKDPSETANDHSVTNDDIKDPTLSCKVQSAPPNVPLTSSVDPLSTSNDPQAHSDFTDPTSMSNYPNDPSTTSKKPSLISNDLSMPPPSEGGGRSEDTPTPAEEEQFKVYMNELSWKRFVPPLRSHREMDSGWALISDLLIALPLSIYVQVIQINYKVDGLEEFLNDPVKQHYLITYLPSSIKTQLLLRRKYFFSFYENLQKLCYMGLLQFGPVEKFMDKDQGFVYLKRHTTIVDTTVCDPHYNLAIETRPFDRRRYSFNSLLDVENYWFDLLCVCLNTPLGVIRPRSRPSDGEREGEEPEATVGTERYERLQYTLRGSFDVDDDGVTPGDGQGAGGLDSSFYGHLKRNWIWTTHQLNKPRKPAGTRSVRLRSLLSKHPLPKSVCAAIQAGASEGKATPGVLEEVQVDVEPSSRNQQVRGGKRNKRRRQKKESSKPPKKKRKVVSVRKQTLCQDETDRKALMRMTRQRVTWTHLEDSILMLCRVASHFLNRKIKKPFVAWNVVRDILHAELELSLDKTSLSVGRRSRYIMKNPQTQLNYRICLAEVYQDKALIEDFMNRINNYDDPKVCADEFKEFVSALRLKFSSSYGASDVIIPDTKEELLTKFKVYVIGQEPSQRSKDVLTRPEDIHSLVLNNLIQSTLVLSNSQMKMCQSFQSFSLYSRYKTDVLQQAFLTCKKRGLVNRRRASKNVEPKKSRAVPFVPMSYQLSQHYYRYFTWRFPSTVYNEVYDLLENLSQKSGADRPNTFSFQQDREPGGQKDREPGGQGDRETGEDRETAAMNDNNQQGQQLGKDKETEPEAQPQEDPLVPPVDTGEPASDLVAPPSGLEASTVDLLVPPGGVESPTLALVPPGEKVTEEQDPAVDTPMPPGDVEIPTVDTLAAPGDVEEPAVDTQAPPGDVDTLAPPGDVEDMLTFPIDAPGGASLCCLSLMTLGLLSVDVSIPQQVVVVDSTLVDSEVVKSITKELDEEEEDEGEDERRARVDVKARQASHTNYLLMRGYFVPGIISFRNTNATEHIAVNSCTVRIQLRHTPSHTLFTETDSALSLLSHSSAPSLPVSFSRVFKRRRVCERNFVKECLSRLGYSCADVEEVCALRATVQKEAEFGIDKQNLLRKFSHLEQVQHGRTRTLQQYVQELVDAGELMEVGALSRRLVCVESSTPWLLQCSKRMCKEIFQTLSIPASHKRSLATSEGAPAAKRRRRDRKTVAKATNTMETACVTSATTESVVPETPAMDTSALKSVSMETIVPEAVALETTLAAVENPASTETPSIGSACTATASVAESAAVETDSPGTVTMETSGARSAAVEIASPEPAAPGAVAMETEGVAAGVGLGDDASVSSVTDSSVQEGNTAQAPPTGSRGAVGSEEEDVVSFVARPWCIVDGSLNKPVCKGMLEALLLHIMTHPCVPEPTLLQHYSGVLQPVVILDLLQVLTELGCVKKRFTVSGPKASLFSRPSVPEVRGSGDISVVDNAMAFYEPSVDGSLRLARLFPHESNWNKWVQLCVR
ncbi:general transcription factor 3C polypeptide 1-like [Hoplias malabaricus]|uniref:general transcription factor 3C polypeptide 1-like n=1 Tax=Hoplias malabaricus TaxID=27720 RepID=UPI003461F1DB